MATTAVAASRKHVELSLELKRKLIQEHEHGVPFTLLGKKYHIATSTAANIWRKKDFFLRSRMSGSRKRCNDRSKYKIVNQVTALFVKSMLERNHKIDGEVIKRFARTAAAQCNFKDFHGSNGWLDSFKKRENVCWVRRRGERAVGSSVANSFAGVAGSAIASSSARRSDSPNLSAAAAAAAVAATAQQTHQHQHEQQQQDQQLQQQQQQQQQHQQQQQQLHRQFNSHRCWEPVSSVVSENEHTCTRCNIAAAAAAVAALNASDSLHERDHEIEDWFHGIPFLCQFFAEYRSMHHQVAAAVAENSGQAGQCNDSDLNNMLRVGGGGVASSSSPPNNQSMAPQCSTASVSSSSSSSSSSSTSSCTSSAIAASASLQVCGGSGVNQQPGNNRMGAGSINCGASSSSAASSNLTAGSNHGLVQSRSLSDARELMETSAILFRASSSMADLQNCSAAATTAAVNTNAPSTSSSSSISQFNRTKSTEMLTSHQSHVKNEPLEYEMTNSYDANNSESFQRQSALKLAAERDFPISENSSATTNQANNNNDQHQLMEITFTNSGEDNSQHQHQQHHHHHQPQQHHSQCSLAGRRNESSNQLDQLQQQHQQQQQQQQHHHHHQQQQPDQHQCCQMNSCSRNTADNSSHSQSCPMISNSDYNSDDQEFYLPSARYIPQDAQSEDLPYHDEVSDHNDCCSDHFELTSGQDGLQLHDYPAELVGIGNGNGELGAGCNYMEEYEYENISRIRHYPIPMPLQQHSSNQTNTNGGNNSRNDSSTNNQFSHSTTSTEINNSANEFTSSRQLQQQQQQDNCLQMSQTDEQGAGNSSGSSPSFIPSSAADHLQLTCQAGASSSTSPPPQEQQQPPPSQSGAHLNAPDYLANTDLESHYSTLMGLHDQTDQTIEHADHEEHNLLHNALMRSPEKLKLIDSIITLLNYASNFNQKMLAPLLEIKRCIERDLEVVLNGALSPR